MTNLELIKAVARNPLAWIAIVLVSAIGVIFGKLSDSTDSRYHSCLAEVAYLRSRVEKVEKTLDDYTNTILLQRGELQNRNYVIDSLTHGTNN